MKAIVGSLYGKLLKVVEENKDIYDCRVVCPHCGSVVKYGEIYMTNGICNCPNCNEEVNRELKEHGHDGRDWEPYGIERKDIKE